MPYNPPPENQETGFNEQQLPPLPPLPETPKKKKKPNRRFILGVCKRIADFTKINVSLIRLVFIILTIIGGWGIAAYFITAALLPGKTSEEPAAINNRYNFYMINGIALILSAGYFILEPTGLFQYMSFMGLRAAFFVPALVFLSIFIAYTIYGISFQDNLPEKFYKSRSNKRIKGVCGGLSKYLNVNPDFLRVITFLLILASGGIILLVYFLISFMSDFEPQEYNEVI